MQAKQAAGEFAPYFWQDSTDLKFPAEQRKAEAAAAALAEKMKK